MFPKVFGSILESHIRPFGQQACSCAAGIGGCRPALVAMTAERHHPGHSGTRGHKYGVYYFPIASSCACYAKRRPFLSGIPFVELLLVDRVKKFPTPVFFKLQKNVVVVMTGPELQAIQTHVDTNVEFATSKLRPVVLAMQKRKPNAKRTQEIFLHFLSGIPFVELFMVDRAKKIS